MNDSRYDEEHRAHTAAVVRRNVWPAAIAAVLMCYFGFQVLLKPEGTDLFARSNWIFYHTLRIGWCWLGMGAALAVDAVVSILIGVLLILSGGGMLIDGGAGINTILVIVFGMMFFSSGRYNWRTYRHLSAGGRVVSEVYTETFQPPAQAAPPVARESEKPPADEPAVTESVSEPAKEPEIEAPPEGFLAAMAKKPPPSQP